MTKAIEEYKRFTSDDKLMRAYASRDAFLVGQKLMLSRERKEGREEGIREGIEKRNYTIAKSMKKENIDIEIIKRITGLTIDEIKKL